MASIPPQHTGPGLVDLQNNGHLGFDFNGDPAGWTPEDFHRVRTDLAGYGLVAVLPTFITAPVESILARAARWAEIVDADAELAAFFPKLHIEGPFLCPIEGPRGAHPPQHIITPADAPDFLDRLRETSGDRIGILSVAPDCPGILPVIEQATQAGICVALAHTGATTEQIDAAIAAGARMSTHLGNGSHQQLPRLNNYIQHQLACDDLAASFIPDGHHMPFTTLKNFLRAKTPDRAVLVSDAMTAAGLGPGTYSLGEGQVEVSPTGRASIPGQDNLAGSTLILDEGVLNVARHCGYDFETAWAMASTRPARLVELPTPTEVTVRIDQNRMTRIR